MTVPKVTPKAVRARQAETGQGLYEALWDLEQERLVAMIHDFHETGERDTLVEILLEMAKGRAPRRDFGPSSAEVVAPPRP